MRPAGSPYGRIGAITGGTHMTLFTAERLLGARLPGVNYGISAPDAAVSRSYLRWLATQGETLPASPRVARSSCVGCCGATRNTSGATRIGSRGDTGSLASRPRRSAGASTPHDRLELGGQDHKVTVRSSAVTTAPADIGFLDMGA